jgi:hypothetical protein
LTRTGSFDRFALPKDNKLAFHEEERSLSMFGYNHLDPKAFDPSRIPAIFGTPKDGSVSKKYNVVPTNEIIGLMKDLGWNAVAASQVKPRKADPNAVRHAVIFQSENAKENENGVTGQVVLVNSHDTHSSYKLYYGLYRFVCANGLMVGDEFAKTKIRHMGKDSLFENIAKATKSFVSHGTEVNDQIDRWRGIHLDYMDQISFVNEAMKLRFSVRTTNWFKPASFLEARNSEDHNNDSLWSVFNKVQENIYRGGIEGRSPKRRIHTRGIQSISKGISFNRALWDLAKEWEYRVA